MRTASSKKVITKKYYSQTEYALLPSFLSAPDLFKASPNIDLSNKKTIGDLRRAPKLNRGMSEKRWCVFLFLKTEIAIFRAHPSFFLEVRERASDIRLTSSFFYSKALCWGLPQINRERLGRPGRTHILQ